MIRASQLSRIVLTVRGEQGLLSAITFYHKAVGLNIRRQASDFCEFDAGNNVGITLKAVSQESQLFTGYSPLITLRVDDLTEKVRECVLLGAHLDGPIQYPAHGKVAAMRTPDGHMIGLYEPNL
jgi:predicted enzyme related to lactoylglutathione lyase